MVFALRQTRNNLRKSWVESYNVSVLHPFHHWIPQWINFPHLAHIIQGTSHPTTVAFEIYMFFTTVKWAGET